MNKVKLFLVIAITLLSLSSCDSHKDKVKEVTKQFVTAINTNDKATIYDIYSDAKNATAISPVKKIADGEIEVEKDEKTGNYIATIQNVKQEKLVFKAEGKEDVKLIQTYGLFQLKDSLNDLAIKSGVPVKKLSDLENNKLMDPKGKYVSFLMKKFSDVIQGGITWGSGNYTWQGGWYPSVSATQAITNGGSVPIKGSDYNVVFTFYSPSGITSAEQKEVEVGVDLQPGESYTYTILGLNGFYNAASQHDLNWDIAIEYKNQSPIASLLKYAKFTGNEYSDFLKASKTKNTGKAGKAKSKK